MGGEGRGLNNASKGIELFHHCARLYSPDGLCATWNRNNDFSNLEHKNGESIETLALRIKQITTKITHVSRVLVLENSFLQKLTLSQLARNGPYRSVFKSIMEKMIVKQAKEWDITRPKLSYQQLTTEISTVLKNSDYYSASKGHCQGDKVTIKANMAETYDKYGKEPMTHTDCVELLQKFWRKDSDTKVVSFANALITQVLSARNFFRVDLESSMIGPRTGTHKPIDSLGKTNRLQLGMSHTSLLTPTR